MHTRIKNNNSCIRGKKEQYILASTVLAKLHSKKNISVTKNRRNKILDFFLSTSHSSPSLLKIKWFVPYPLSMTSRTGTGTVELGLWNTNMSCKCREVTNNGFRVVESTTHYSMNEVVEFGRSGGGWRRRVSFIPSLEALSIITSCLEAPRKFLAGNLDSCRNCISGCLCAISMS